MNFDLLTPRGGWGGGGGAGGGWGGGGQGVGGGGLWVFVASFNFIIKYLELSPGNQLKYI